MNQKNTPQLKKISQCSKTLDFEPLSEWPEGLPAVAINGLVLAGFAQTFVFDHSLDPDDAEEIARLFRSLYFELSAVELARLAQKAQGTPWLPIEIIFSKFNVRWSEQVKNICKAMSFLPKGFQNFCAQKKWSISEFSILLSSSHLKLEPLYLALINSNASKSMGTQIFEHFIELRLMGLENEKLLMTDGAISVESWLHHLKKLRYPKSSQDDEKAENKIQKMNLPGNSTARWVRHGDKTGIELKFFVSQPSDLKKYMASLSQFQESLEKEGPWKKH